MIATARAPRPLSSLPPRLLPGAALVVASLAAVAATLVLQQYALAVMAAVLGGALTLWRPRVGLYLAVLLAVALEPITIDPVMTVGWIAQSDVSSWSPLSFLVFTPVEALVALTALAVLGRAVLDRRAPPRAQLLGPLLVFLALLVLSVLWGVGRGGGSANKALWEMRNLVVGVTIALLIPAVLETRAQTERFLSVMAVAVVVLSVEIIVRRFTVLPGAAADTTDLAFGHETPVFMNFTVVLLLARLIWPARPRQRLWVLMVPIILWAEMLTGRRAGWVGLDVALILLAVFMFRLRRAHFYLLVLPLALIYCGYLVTFWNAQGALAEPARAVRSISDPEGRDLSSNLYRQTETGDVRQNIHAHPLTGLGFGQPYVFYIPLPDLSWWPFWHYVPHNAMLWLWLKTGPAGFVAFLTLIGVGIARGVQLLKQRSRSESAPFIAALVSGLLMVPIYSYVDIGLTSVRLCAFLGLALGVIGVWGRKSAEESA
ncbi:MAG TPA: O-antigen ligase family protein [Dehalococcoidia bacterium]|nr:O-antigen ligase family protein [Dehalococcoidia bacterium]